VTCDRRTEKIGGDAAHTRELGHATSFEIWRELARTGTHMHAAAAHGADFAFDEYAEYDRSLAGSPMTGSGTRGIEGAVAEDGAPLVGAGHGTEAAGGHDGPDVQPGARAGGLGGGRCGWGA
jgi:hypothetical protein